VEQSTVQQNQVPTQEIYRVFHLKNSPDLHAQNDETNGNNEFLQPYPAVATDALFEIGTAVKRKKKAVSSFIR
jgi:hypothetical protein